MFVKFNDKVVEIIMLWFKNLMVYCFSCEILLCVEEMEKQLVLMVFILCGSQDMVKMGWVFLMGLYSDVLMYVVNG